MHGLLLLGAEFSRVHGTLRIDAAFFGMEAVAWRVFGPSGALPVSVSDPPLPDRLADGGWIDLRPMPAGLGTRRLVLRWDAMPAADATLIVAATGAGGKVLTASLRGDAVREARAVEGGVSGIRYTPWNGQLAVRGWFVAWRRLTRLDVWCDGRRIGGAVLEVPRGDVSPKFPHLEGEHAGWEFKGRLPQPPGSQSAIELHAYAGDEHLFMRTRRLDPVRDIEAAPRLRPWERAARPLGRWLPARLPTALLRAALGSPWLARSWRAGGPWGDVRTALAQELAGRGGGPLWLVLRDGSRVWCDPFADRVVARSFLVNGGYEELLLAALPRLLRSGEAMIDVGACYGHVALAAARCVGPTGRVLALEPNPDALAFLRRNAAAAPNLKVLPLAAADRAGELVLNVDGVNFGATSLLPASAEAVAQLPVLSLAPGRWGQAEVVPPEPRRAVTVRTAPLDEVVASEGVRPALVKLDVEGAEALVLDGAAGLLAGHPAPVWIVEHSLLVGPPGSSAAVFDRFRAQGYRAFRFEAAGGAEAVRFQEVARSEEAPAHCNLVFVRAEGVERLAGPAD